MSISLFRIPILISVIILLSPRLAAQIFESDSILSAPSDSTRAAGGIIGSSILNEPYYLPQNYKFTPELSSAQLPPIDIEIPRFTPGEADIFSWGSGGFKAFGKIDTYPGLMNVESGGVAFGQTFGKFHLRLDAEATKYGYFRGLSKSYSFGGSLTYNINDRLSFTLQGAYHTNPGLYQPAMFEITKASSVGGLFDYKINDRWGVLFGAETYHSLTSGHWDVRPVAMPYYLVGGVVPIGIDVGGIVFEIIRSAIERKSGSGSSQNPTIGPPIPVGSYPVRPKNW